MNKPERVNVMTPRNALINALTHAPPTGRVPHFELEFFLTMEAFGRIHPSHRQFRQWDQMSENERDRHRRDVADLHVQIYRRFGLAGTIFSSPGGWTDNDIRLALEHLRDLSGMEFFTCLHGDATYSLPNGHDMMDFVMKLADQPQQMKDDTQQRVDHALARAEIMKDWGVLDGFALCADCCFNDNPFLSPAMFDEDVIADTKRALEQGMPGGAYIFGTSNCIYTGMELDRYDLMLDVWKKHGNYSAET